MDNEKSQPWKRVRLTPTQEANLYEAWGNHFHLMHMYQTSEEAYTNSLNIRPNDFDTLLERSQCKRNLAKLQSGLEDLQKCSKLNSRNATVDAGICHFLYDLNRLEDSLVTSHNNKYKYTGHKIEEFDNLIQVLNDNLMDSLGQSLSPHIMRNERVFEIVGEQMQKEKIIDLRLLWKRLRDEKKCDVQSILDEEIIELSPLEKARRLKELHVFLQMYVGKSWKDIMFLKNLENNSNFLLSYCEKSKSKLLRELCTGKDSIFKFLKMLQVRSPIYNELNRKYSNRNALEYLREKYLYRVQYQTRRDMNMILRTSHRLRREGKLKSLADYVEKEMGDYVVIKTFRVMPWKFEFINEVYNLLGLAYIDKISIPTDCRSLPLKTRLAILLQIPKSKTYANAQFVFGRRSQYTVSGAKDPAHENYKLYLERIRKRLIFVKYPIEKSYLFYELARSHNNQSNHDECSAVALKSIDAAKSCNNALWQFLSIIEIAKARGALLKLENLGEILIEALDVSKKLNNKNIEEYTELLMETTSMLIDKKMVEQQRLLGQLKNRRSNMSMRVSRITSQTSQSQLLPTDEN